MGNHVAPPPDTVQHLLNGYRVTQCLYVAARLGIADLLAVGPTPVEELAAATGAHPDALYRVLRALASLGVFEEVTPRRFALTPVASALRTDHPRSLRSLVIFQGADPYRAWGDLMHSVMTGQTAFDYLYGTGHFEYLARHAEQSAVFDGAMSDLSRREAAAVVGAYDFPAAGTVVDVGGGQGILVAAVLRANPGLRGILFDQPHVVARAGTVLEEAGVADRCVIAGGDFFAAVPDGGDRYLLRNILHDWDDERAVAILRSVALAMAPGAKVLVVESVIEAGTGNDAATATFRDVHMLVMTGGRERTAEEHSRLFAAAGLRLLRTILIGTGASIIEGERM